MTDKHESPCQSLKNTRTLLIGIITLQALFVMSALGISVSTMNRVSSLSERQVQIIERQRIMEKKTDAALAKSSSALTIAGKSESNIAWIREGLTEVKIQIRTAINEGKKDGR